MCTPKALSHDIMATAKCESGLSDLLWSALPIPLSQPGFIRTAWSAHGWRWISDHEHFLALQPAPVFTLPKCTLQLELHFKRGGCGGTWESSCPIRVLSQWVYGEKWNWKYRTHLGYAHLELWSQEDMQREEIVEVGMKYKSKQKRIEKMRQ